MNTVSRLFVLCLILLSSVSNAQQNISKQSLKSVLTVLENDFQCNFNYHDQQLESHFVDFSKPKSLSEALSILADKTLFNFTLLDKEIIAVSLKHDLKKVCGRIRNANINEEQKKYTVITDYQRLTIEGEKNFTFLSKEDSEVIFIYPPDNRAKSVSMDFFENEDCRTIVFDETVELLQPITLISNYLARGISQNLNGSTTIDFNEFDILPGLIEPDVLKSIQELPGILSVNETVSNINIRGGTSDQTLILWDGIKMYQTGHFFGLISAFNPYLTSRATITKNGSSAFYGDGVSGIVELETEKKLNTTYKVNWGFNLLSTDAFLDLPLSPKMSLQLSGRKSINNLIESPTYASYFEKSFQNTEVVGFGKEEKPSRVGFSFFDTNARLLYKPTDKDLFNFNFIILGNQLGLTEVGDIDNEQVFRNSNLSQNNISTGLYYRKNWNQKFLTEIQAYGSLYKLKAVNANIPDNQALSQENHVTENGLKVGGNFNFNSDLKLAVGYHFNETGIENFQEINNPFLRQLDKQVLRTNSLYAQLNYTIPKLKTVIYGGVRANHINKFNTVLVEPRISINKRFLKYFSFQVLGEIKSQTTSQIIDFQNDFLGVENRRWVLSSPNQIPIIQGKQLSTGFTFKRKGWLASAEGYIKKITGITSQSQGFQNQFEDARETGSYTIQGVDLLVNRQYKRINTWFSYSYTSNNYRFNNFMPSVFPNNLHIKNAVTTGINYTIGNLKVSSGLNWHTGKPTTILLNTENENGELNYDLPNNENIKNFFRLDFSAIYNFKINENMKGLAGFSIWNSLNNQNTLNHYYRIRSGEVEEINEGALSLTPNFTFRFFLN